MTNLSQSSFDVNTFEQIHEYRIKNIPHACLLTGPVWCFYSILSLNCDIVKTLL